MLKYKRTCIYKSDRKTCEFIETSVKQSERIMAYNTREYLSL